MQNYVELLKDPVFYKSLFNTIYLLILLVFIQIPIALILAYLLFTEVKGFKFLRTVYFVPVIISTVAIALMFYFIYETNFGILNSLLRAIGLGHLTQSWLQETSTAMTAVSMPLVWSQVGLMMIILLAGLQGVPREVLEAAEIDGANAWQKLTRVIVPMISNIIVICLVLAITNAFKQFDFVLILTEGGPSHRTEVTGTYMYNEGFRRLNYGFGSAIAMSIMCIAIAITLIVKGLTSRKE